MEGSQAEEEESVRIGNDLLDLLISGNTILLQHKFTLSSRLKF